MHVLPYTCAWVEDPRLWLTWVQGYAPTEGAVGAYPFLPYTQEEFRTLPAAIQVSLDYVRRCFPPAQIPPINPSLYPINTRSQLTSRVAEAWLQAYAKRAGWERVCASVGQYPACLWEAISPPNWGPKETKEAILGHLQTGDALPTVFTWGEIEALMHRWPIQRKPWGRAASALAMWLDYMGGRKQSSTVVTLGLELIYAPARAPLLLTGIATRACWETQQVSMLPLPMFGGLSSSPGLTWENPPQEGWMPIQEPDTASNHA